MIKMSIFIIQSIVIVLLCRETLSFNLAVTSFQQVDRLILKESLLAADVSSTSSDKKQSTRDGDKGSSRTRSQRKAFDREKKARHNEESAIGRKQNPRLKLRSNEGGKREVEALVPVLNSESTYSEVLSAIKRAQIYNETHNLKVMASFLLEFTDNNFASGKKGSLLSRLAVAALHLNNHMIAADAINCRRVNFSDAILPMESAALVRNLLRVKNVSEAYRILEDELSLPIHKDEEASLHEFNLEQVKYRAETLASIASWHFLEGEPRSAVHACGMLASMGRVVRESGMSGSYLGLPFPRLLQTASKCQSLIRTGEIAVKLEDSRTQDVNRKLARVQIPCNVVYSVLEVLMSLPSQNDDRVFELLSNALIRRVLFVTGAVNMDGCPLADRGEAAFIGRSNVGKSSLVNMITNRKSLAYISKRPGKTQQFNFFAVNDKAGREREIKYGDVVDGVKDADSFYIVDLPGFGYAKVSEQKQQAWATFMSDYIANRKTLRVLFHLVDSRVGPTEEDGLIMKQVDENLPSYTKYVIVLTKADKIVKGARENCAGKVSKDILQKLRRVMSENLKKDVPVVVTSAESKLGRDEIWTYLRLAATS